MIHMRPSVPGDVPRQRELWALAFGDSGDYVDNFYNNYYRPERVLVLEEEGVIQAMTAWFDTTLAMPDGNRWKAGYLYAVATHPEARGRGLAGALLKYADFYLKEEQHCQAVTTVPAEPSLHNFFAANGFRECFVLNQGTLEPGDTNQPIGDNPLRPATPEEYGAVREGLLAGIPHIAYPQDALTYQAGCCALSGGGLYVGQTELGPVCLCAEGDGSGLMVFKELLGGGARRLVLPHLTRMFPARRWMVRSPMPDDPQVSGGWQFGMLKWLYPGLEGRWDWSSTAYMGLGFD